MSQVVQDQKRLNWVQISPNSSKWVKMVPYSGKNRSKWRSVQVTLIFFCVTILEFEILFLFLVHSAYRIVHSGGVIRGRACGWQMTPDTYFYFLNFFEFVLRSAIINRFRVYPRKDFVSILTPKSNSWFSR